MHALVCIEGFCQLSSIPRVLFSKDGRKTSVSATPNFNCSYGHLTWEWAAGLRSYAHPTLFAMLYWALKWLRLDSSWAVKRGPLLLQAVAAAAADLYVYNLSELLFGSNAARQARSAQPIKAQHAFPYHCLDADQPHFSPPSHLHYQAYPSPYPLCARCFAGGLWRASCSPGSIFIRWSARIQTAWRQCSCALECITCSAPCTSFLMHQQRCTLRSACGC